MTDHPAPDETERERPPPPLPRDVCFTFEGFKELCDRHIAQRDLSDRLSTELDAAHAQLRAQAVELAELRAEIVELEELAGLSLDRARRIDQMQEQIARLREQRDRHSATVRAQNVEAAEAAKSYNQTCGALVRERDALRAELAALKAGRVSGVDGVCLCRFGSTCDVCGPPPSVDRSAHLPTPSTSCPGCRTVAPASHAQGCTHAPDSALDVLRRLMALVDEPDHKVLGSQQYQNEWRDIWAEARALLSGAQ